MKYLILVLLVSINLKADCKNASNALLENYNIAISMCKIVKSSEVCIRALNIKEQLDKEVEKCGLKLVDKDDLKKEEKPEFDPNKPYERVDNEKTN